MLTEILTARMFSHIFDASYYTTSLYAYPVLIVGTLLGALGIAVLAKERGSHVGLTFVFMTSSAALWLLASAAIYSASFEQEAQVCTKVQMIGVVLIPSSVYIFTLTISATSPISDLGVEQRYTFCPLLSQHHFD